MYINGKWTESTNVVKVTNPANGELVGTVPTVDKSEVREAIDAADQAFTTWSALSAEDRASYMYKVAELMRENTDELARIATLEMGKSLTDMKAEVKSAIDYVQRSEEHTSELQSRFDL